MQLLCVADSDAFIPADKKLGFTSAATPTEAWESKVKPTPASARLSLGSSLALEAPALQIPSGNRRSWAHL